MGKTLRVVCSIVAMNVSAIAAFAEEVTSEQAQVAVRNWIRKNPSPMTEQFASDNGKVETFSKEGRVLFHVVKLEGGGFVVTASDTKISPIVAFSDSGEFHHGDDNPLASLLGLALKSKLDKACSSSVQKASVSEKRLLLNTVSPSDENDEYKLAEKAWSDLLSEPEGNKRTAKLFAVSPQSAMSDMRVAPLVKTSWGQRYWNGNNPKEAVFNYYTPTCPCGCVATAAAQVMRTMRFPDKYVEPRTFTCSMESREEEHTMYGGTYNWDLMPYSASDVTTLSQAQKQEIGKLTWDIGASVNMNYTSGNSTTGLAQLRSALVDVFGFKSANLLVADRVYGTTANQVDACAMFASLDAGLPIFGGIFQVSQDNAGKIYTAGGHCILFDGYGFIGATPYVHMNCGYNGGGDVWYAFFTEFLVNVSSYKYNYIYQLIYNVDCRETGDVISGRVLDVSGLPVASAEVSLSDASGRTIATTRTTSYGVWACRVPIGPGTNFVSAATATAASKTSRVIRQGTVTPDGSSTVIGNRWGIELRLEDIPLEQVEPPILNPSRGGFSGSSVSVSMTCGTPGATIRYTSDGSEPTSSSARYSSAILVSGTTTIRARAFKDGMRPSETITVVYEQNVFTGSSDIAAALDCPSSSSFSFSSSVYYSRRGETIYLDSSKVAECVYGQTQETFDGVDAVMLKAHPSSTGFATMWGATTKLSMTVRGSGLLKFKYKALKNGGRFNGVNFGCYVNGTSVASNTASDSGEPEWTSVAIAVADTGDNTIAWSTSLDSTFVSSPSSFDDIRAAVVLDALEWIPGTVVKHSVTYDLNGDESGMSPPATSAGYTGERTSVPVDAGYVREGYVFGGWNTEPDGSGVTYWPKASFVHGETDVVLYARWCKIVEVPFDFASSGGVHSFDIASFTGSRFRGYGTLPDWVGVSISDERGNFYGGSSRLGIVSFAADATLHLSVPANPESKERLFSWGVISETYNEVPVFMCRQHGDASHTLDGLVIDGPESVVAGTSAALTAVAHYRDGTSERVSGCTWNILSGEACGEVSSVGILTGKSLTAASVVTVSAKYREGDAQISVDKDFVVLPTVTLGESLNAETTTFQTGTGSEAWVGQSGVSADGISAARCGSCLNASPWIEFNLPKGRSLSFACRLSEGSGRNLTIYVDGQATDRFISTVDMSDWLSWEITAANRARTIRVVYQWHGSKSPLAAEEDCAWIDYVNFGDLPQLELPNSASATISCKISFDANGGTGTMAQQTFVSGEVQALAPCAFEQTGCVFCGWATSANGSVAYADGQSVAISSDTTLYAVWKVCTPQGLTATTGLTDGVALAWTGPELEGLSYFVSRSESDDPATRKSIGWTAELSFVDGTATPGVRYYYWVYAGRTVMDASDLCGPVAGMRAKVSTPDPELTLASIYISGWSIMESGATRTYECYAEMSDGSRAQVSPVWSLTGGEGLQASVSTSGVLSAVNNTGVEAVVYVNASYAQNGVTKTALISVIVSPASLPNPDPMFSVIFNANGGTVSPVSRSVASGAAVGTLPTPTRMGYTFAGWYTAATGGTKVTASTKVTANATYYAHWTQNGGGTTPVKPTPEPEPEPELYEEVDGAAPALASVYDGYLVDAKGNVAGSIQVKVGKPKAGLASVKATVVVGVTKSSLKGADNGKAAIAANGPTAMRLVGGESCEVTLGAEGLSGSYGPYQIYGARNFFSSKDNGEQGAANAILETWIGAVNVAWREEGAARSAIAPYQTLSVTIGKKGKAKVAVTLANGTKATANAQLLVGEEWLCVPVVVTKKTSLAFTLWLPIAQDAAPMVDGLGAGAVVGKPGALKAGAKFHVGKSAALWTSISGTVLTDYIPDGFKVASNGAKWTLPKAGKVQKAKDGTIDSSKLGENPSALKLTYKAKDGSFNGSFKVYADNGGKLKATTVNVVGVVINGVGYGTATIKKVGSVPVRVE